VAGLFLPWTSLVGGGSLHSLLLKNQLAAVAFGAAIVVYDQMNLQATVNANQPAFAEGSGGWLASGLWWVTLSCWFVLLTGWFYLLRTCLRQQTDLVSVMLGRSGLWLPLVIPPVAVGISLALLVTGNPWHSLLVVVVPLLMILLPVLLMVAGICYHYLIGKPIRWN
jgi:hypothetical protein